MELYEELLKIIDALAEADFDYALCGGLAVALYGYPRFTEDIDLLIRPKDLDRAIGLVGPLGFVFVAKRMTFGTAGVNQRIVHRISKIEDEEVLTLDLLLAGSTFERVWKERSVFEWHGRRVKVVSLGGLAEMKRLAGRTQDILDLEKLGL